VFEVRASYLLESYIVFAYILYFRQCQVHDVFTSDLYIMHVVRLRKNCYVHAIPLLAYYYNVIY